MHRISRQLSCNQSIDIEKKLQVATLDEQSNPITCTEDLSNEMFYEIFDYLDVCDIFEAFSNLNSRFQNLLNSPLLLLKLNRLSTSKEIFQNNYKNVFGPSRQRIISLVLWHQLHINLFFYQHPIDSSFSRLESLVLKNITSKRLVTFYPILNSLPRLFSLTIRLGDQYPDLSDVYQMIFQLNFLKYYKLSTLAFSSSFAFSITPNQISSTLERLVINHSCTINQLSIILFCTPRLHRLICKRLVPRHDDVAKEIPITLPRLTYVSIGECYVYFDEFEIFITKICSQLQIFHITIKSKDEVYLNDDRWKRLISQHMFQLRKFNFEYIDFINDMFRLIPYNSLSDLFTSSFLSEWRWFSEFFIYKSMAKYSLYSNKNNYYEMYDHNENNLYIGYYYNNSNLIQHIINRNRLKIVKPIIQSTLLTIKDVDCIQFNLPLGDNIQSFFSARQFTHLNVDCRDMSIILLINLIHLLPHLDYLKIISIVPPTMQELSSKQAETLRLVSNNNKITKVHVTQLKDVGEADFLVDLCPHIEYFEVECTKNVDLELLIVSILINQNINCTPHLRTLCVYIQNENDVSIEILQQIIDAEKLLDNYSIQHIDNSVILQW